MHIPKAGVKTLLKDAFFALTGEEQLVVRGALEAYKLGNKTGAIKFITNHVFKLGMYGTALTWVQNHLFTSSSNPEWFQQAVLQVMQMVKGGAFAQRHNDARGTAQVANMSATPGIDRARGGKAPAQRNISIATPARRAISAEPPSSRRSVHTPLDRSATRDLLASVRRGVSASGGRRNNNNAPTPHATAARRALHQRRTAMFTPGKNRRRSLREQRETPMGILRNLSKVLAPTSQPVVSSSPRGKPSSIPPIPEESDDELPIDPPRLSLPLEDDDSDLQPPRSSGLEDLTMGSVERPRRAYSEQPGSRLSRGSYGSVRSSDIFNNDPTADLGRPSDFFPGFLEDLEERPEAAADLTYDRIDVEAPWPATLERDSDFGLELPPGLDDQTTFLMAEPAEDSDDEAPGGQSFAEAPPQDEYDEATGGAPEQGDFDMPDPETMTAELTEIAEEKTSRAASRKAKKRVSRHGIEYPPLPPPFVKRVAQTALQSSGLSNPRISADTLTALTQASEWYFEQLGDDLGAYAQHAKRKTIEESDVATLMGRQRQVGSDVTLFSLAQKHLPRELLQDLRMPLPQPTKSRRTKRSRAERDNDEDATEVT
ncbi:subtilisin [Purpureocillium lavendulum]|uniref:Subtilisin n=1 Tax=Purpureocillium lavendulum TaxID=1247861 RepID=A0AB34FZ19_9HYPO|nr:subtilisin [Purpureocillium lavendulum]